MQELKFKTSINCGNCVNTVKGFLNDLKDIEWDVDTLSKDKVLTVKGINLQEEQIVDSVESAGFDIERLK